MLVHSAEPTRSIMSILADVRGSRRHLVIATAAACAVLLALPAVGADAAPRGLPEGRCATDPPDAGYDDRDEISAAHVDAVDCLTQLGIAEGSEEGGASVFEPAAEVRRDQMATFIVRTLVEAGVELPSEQTDGFGDVEGSVHADAIGRLAAAGIVRGVTGDRYEPAASVRRDQMASFLVRAQAYQAGVEPSDLQGGDTPFQDVAADSVHQPSIQGIYQLGVAAGTSSSRYAPSRPVTREAMASFLARTLDAMLQRTTVVDRDTGALAHTTFTFASETDRCFQVTAGTAWTTQCSPATDETLQLRSVTVSDDFTVLAGLVTPAVTRVVVDTTDADRIEVELVDTESDLRAFSSPILADDVEVVVAYDGDQEVARTSPDDATSPPFPADTSRDEAAPEGDPVVVTDIATGHHQTYDRTVFEVAGGGHAGWSTEYVDEAVAIGSAQPIEVDGNAILEINLTNTRYPSATELDTYEPGTRFDGVHAIEEIYYGTTFEGSTQVVIGTAAETPFRVFKLEDPNRVVVDVVHPRS